MAYKDPVKQREYNRRIGHKYYAQRKDLMAWYKAAPCMDCGGAFPPECMDFDHVPGRGEKLFNVSLASLTFCRETVESEMAKCDLVCSNCHRIRTRKRAND